MTKSNSIEKDRDGEFELISQLPDDITEPEPSEIELKIDESLDVLFSKDSDERSVMDEGPYSSVRWPSFDQNSPDYAHIDSEESVETFDLSHDAIERLISWNRFKPNTENNVICIALRGAVLESGNEAIKQSKVRVREVRPDHINFHCLIGYYFLKEKKITLFSSSTVPCRKAVWNYVNSGGSACNLLPTGLYSYFVWRHKNLRPALRLSVSNKSNADLEKGAIANVLRTQNDTIFGTKDIWDVSRPYDNVHCSYFLNYSSNYGSRFSSWGCLTIRGRKTPSHQWQEFQSVLTNLGSRSAVDLVLLTGKDAGLAASPAILDSAMVRLRQGSVGKEVTRLQIKLGLNGSGFFGPVTRSKLVEKEQDVFGSATGVYTPDFDAKLGWKVFDGE